MARLLRGFIFIYQSTLSLLLGPRCRFYPSCSEYAKTALSRYPLIDAISLILKRLLKCHPWHPGGVDEVPQKDKA